MFEYSDGSNPGPQHPELFAKSAPNQYKQLEYFAHQFQFAIHEHSGEERKKYRATEDYVQRAQGWITTDQSNIVALQSGKTEDKIKSSTGYSETLTKRNAGMRQLTGNPWPSPFPENRLVFPPDFATKYMSYVSITSGGPYGRQGIVEEFSRVDAWTDVVERNTRYSACTEDERNRIWLDTRSCSDILRLLIIDSAVTSDVERRTHIVETVLLLAHHPKVGLHPFLRNGMSCCNLNAGMTSLVEKVLPVFIYLNLLWTCIDGCPDSPLLQPCDHVHQYQPSHHHNSRFESLLPRPAYMNTQSFNYLLETVLKEHGHIIEHVFFNPLFAPYTSGTVSRYLDPRGPLSSENQRTERDVLADPLILKETLKSMWKMLIYCDMIFGDIGQPVNWRHNIFSSLADLFPGKAGLERILEKSWTDYELDMP